MEQLITKARHMIQFGKIEKDGNSWTVDDQIVVKKSTRAGQYLSCSCPSCTWQVNTKNLCSRQIAVILFESQDKKLKEFIQNKIKFYEGCEKINMMPDISTIISDLNLIRGML